jgi:hypothetical protein
MPRASFPSLSGTSSQSRRSPSPSLYLGIPILHDPNLFRSSLSNRRSTAGVAEIAGRTGAAEIAGRSGGEDRRTQTAETRTRQRAAASGVRCDIMPVVAHHLQDKLPAPLSHAILWSSFCRAVLLGDGARKDWWRVVGEAAVSPCAWWMTSPLGTPRGRYDECSG